MRLPPVSVLSPSPMPAAPAAGGGRAALACLALVVLYAPLAAVSGRYPPGGEPLAWNPAAGLALGWMMALGSRYTPLLFLSVLLAARLAGGAHPPLRLLLVAAATALLWGAAAAWLRRPRSERDPWHPTNVMRLVAAAFLVPIPVAVVHAGLLGADPLDSADGRAALLTFWLGDATGVLATAPFVLIAMVYLMGPAWQVNTPAVPVWGTGPITRVVVLQASTAFAAAAVAWFAGTDAGPARHYLYLVPLLWAAIRWGLGGAAVAILILNVTAGVVEPAALMPERTGLSELQLFMLALSTTGLTLASVTSARAREQARSQRRARQLEAAEQVSQTGSWEWELDTDRAWWSAELRRLLGTPAEVRPSLQAFLKLIHEEDRRQLQAAVRRSLAGDAELDEAVRLCTPGGDVRHVVLRGAVRPDPGGRMRLTASCQDRTAQVQAEVLARHAALHDTLTGLPNRAHLLERLAELKPGYAVLLAEVDRLEAVNDSLGHRAGDEIICAVAHRLRQRVNGGGMVARLGGGEFALLLERGGAAEAEWHARWVLQELGQPVPLAGGEVLPGGRVGAALGAPGLSGEEALRQARTALFHARQSGSDRYALFEPRMQAAAAERLRLVGELHRALSAGELCLAYQPVISLRSGNPRGVEALLRWRHPERGLLVAGTFVPAAEEAGLMSAVDEWGLSTACREFRGCLVQEAGVLAVNVSAREAAHPRFRQVVESALAESSLRPERLMVEVTESVLLEDTDAAASSLRALAEVGVGIALDDFGSGYSSLRYLHRFPVAAVKIDRAFVEHIADDARSRAVVRAVLAVAQSIGATTVAEGIETEVQEQVLRDLGCAYAQGFRYAPGLPGAEAASWLAAHRLASGLNPLGGTTVQTPALPA